MDEPCLDCGNFVCDCDETPQADDSIQRDIDSAIFADRWRCAWQCVGEAVRHDDEDSRSGQVARDERDQLKGARNRLRAQLAEARALLEEVSGWRPSRHSIIGNRARAWLANRGTK